jgi:hypothetical protein
VGAQSAPALVLVGGWWRTRPGGTNSAAAQHHERACAPPRSRYHPHAGGLLPSGSLVRRGARRQGRARATTVGRLGEGTGSNGGDSFFFVRARRQAAGEDRSFPCGTHVVESVKYTPEEGTTGDSLRCT